MATQVQVQQAAAGQFAMATQVQIQQAAAGGGPAAGSSLYVGDLEANVTESQLFDLFARVGSVMSVRVCRDVSSQRSLGYAYVNFGSAAEAARALETLNFFHLNEKPIRIMYSNRDPAFRKSGSANIFIKNLDKSIDHKALHETFSTFGNILSCKLVTDSSGQSRGYGFVQFEQENAAQKAIENLNGMLLNDKQVYVGPFRRKQERENVAETPKFNNVFVKNLSESTTEDDLTKTFGDFGNITSVVVMREGGKSKGFGFINFEHPSAAARAVEELNGKKFDDKEWYVGKAQKKSERELELKGRFEQSMKEAEEKFKGVNLYLKNLDVSMGDDQLKELFSEFGSITSCKVMRDPSGVSRGTGFVAFKTPEEASRALADMSGKIIGNKPLYVALAERKEERKAKLQAQFSQARPVSIAPTVAPHVPVYPPGAQGIGQPLYYARAPPTLVPQPGFSYQQQLVPGMRPGGAHIPNYYMPFVQQGPQGHRPGGRRGGAAPLQQTQQPMPLLHQQMHPRARMYRYPPSRNLPDGITNVPYDMGGHSVRDTGLSQPMPIGVLASNLANAPPEQQRLMLGESLYPLVDELEHDHAAKVTGMLLEMDQTEVLHLLEDPGALKAKVTEAMEVLKNVTQQQSSPSADQLAALSLSDGLSS